MMPRRSTTDQRRAVFGCVAAKNWGSSTIASCRRISAKRRRGATRAPPCIQPSHRAPRKLEREEVKHAMRYASPCAMQQAQSGDAGALCTGHDEDRTFFSASLSRPNDVTARSSEGTRPQSACRASSCDAVVKLLTIVLVVLVGAKALADRIRVPMEFSRAEFRLTPRSTKRLSRPVLDIWPGPDTPHVARDRTMTSASRLFRCSRSAASLPRPAAGGASLFVVTR